MTDHENYREWPAAYVLGALDADEREAFEEHLRSCAVCVSEVSEFAPIPGLLARADEPIDVPAPDRIAELAVERVRSEWSGVVRSRNRWRVVAVAAVLAALTVVAAYVPEPAIEAPAAVFELQVGSEASGLIEADTRFWGTALEFDLADLPTGDRYEAWAVARDGEWQQVAVWGPTPSSRARLEGSSSFQLDDVERVVITSGGRDRPIGTATR